ncbi:MAG: hypothetical protein IJV39_02675, partial [Ruminococcus sp.]|nr:hypothetical protein [Ruminococcus sp.]
AARLVSCLRLNLTSRLRLQGWITAVDYSLPCRLPTDYTLDTELSHHRLSFYHNTVKNSMYFFTI